MYFATNIKAVATAMTAKAPRPMAEVMLEYYPDCTIDCNDRGHAPYDGYECPFTGQQFRAGEYLPFDPDEDDTPRGRASDAIYFLVDGKVVQLEGTKSQRAAGAAEAKEQTAAHDHTAAHVGTVKKRENFTLTLLMMFADFGVYGTIFTHLMRDENGNPVVYKGSKRLEMKLGETRTIKATVKSHWNACDGRRATYINRPAMGAA